MSEASGSLTLQNSSSQLRSSIEKEKNVVPPEPWSLPPPEPCLLRRQDDDYDVGWDAWMTVIATWVSYGCIMLLKTYTLNQGGWFSFALMGLLNFFTGTQTSAYIFDSFASYVSAFGVYQDYYTRSFLNTESPSNIRYRLLSKLRRLFNFLFSWIGSFQLFMQYAPGMLVGRAFDLGYW